MYVRLDFITMLGQILAHHAAPYQTASRVHHLQYALCAILPFMYHLLLVCAWLVVQIAYLVTVQGA